MSSLARIRQRLREAGRPDGGFGVRAGLPSRTEPTALALLALADDADAESSVASALGWLRAVQHPDGGWPLGADVPEPSWAGALAVLALARLGEEGRARRGAAWLLEREGRRPGWRARMVQRLRTRRVVDQDPSLRGWPWTDGASSWVEPTAYALLALRSLAPELPRGARARIEEGEQLLLDRMCPGGGWNYGNSVVLDVALEPYPDTTALALLALRDHAEAEPQRRSLAALEHMLGEHHSGLALSWSILCLEAYGRETRELRARLEASFAARGFLEDTRALALAGLALGGGARWLGGAA